MASLSAPEFAVEQAAAFSPISPQGSPPAAALHIPEEVEDALESGAHSRGSAFARDNGTPASSPGSSPASSRAPSPASGSAVPARQPSFSGGGKGLMRSMGGKGPMMRHRSIQKPPLEGITKGDLRRLARRGGVKRISGICYDETRGALKEYLTKIIKDAVVYTAHANRKTVTAGDVVYALKRNGKTLYGYGM